FSGKVGSLEKIGETGDTKHFDLCLEFYEMAFLRDSKSKSFVSLGNYNN
ncbi:13388_t:CDS:2, partial [Entrophospora sp. SA101]